MRIYTKTVYPWYGKPYVTVIKDEEYYKDLNESIAYFRKIIKKYGKKK